MLLDSLGRHPQLYAFPYETRLFPYLAAKERELGDLNDDTRFRLLWNEVLGIPAFQRASSGEPTALPLDWRGTPRNLAGIIEAVMSTFAATESKTHWCEKSPQYAQHVALLHELFPKARFIHVVRDGRDCAVSLNRRWLRSPVLTIYRWKKLVTECRRQSQALPDTLYFEVRYEDLTAEPEQWLRRLCKFLGLSFVESVLESSQPYMRAPADAASPDAAKGIRQNTGNWKTYFPLNVQSQLESIGGATLNEFGYKTSRPHSNVDLSRVRRQVLVAKDSAAQFVREVKLKLGGEIERPWRVILAKPFNARKQRAHNKL